MNVLAYPGYVYLRILSYRLPWGVLAAASASPRPRRGILWAQPRAGHGSARRFARAPGRFPGSPNGCAAGPPLCAAVVRGVGAVGGGPARLALARLPPARRRDPVDQSVEVRQDDPARGAAG